MGKEFIDFWTTGHFFGGIAGRVSVYPNNPKLSFLINFLIHLFIEIVEKNDDSQTETMQNHIGDMLFFILGWFFGEVIERCVKIPYMLRATILVAYVYFSMREILREFFLPLRYNDFDL